MIFEYRFVVMSLSEKLVAVDKLISRHVHTYHEKIIYNMFILLTTLLRHLKIYNNNQAQLIYSSDFEQHALSSL